MTRQQRFPRAILLAFVIAALAFTFAPRTARANDAEFDAITHHLKLRYNARRVSIPFLGLANFFVKIIRPAGVKGFKVAVFENLKSQPGSVNAELGAVLRNALSPDWQPLVRMRSREGDQTYIYARGDGDNFKLMVVNIERTDAVVVRVKVSPKKLSEFMNDPKLLGVHLNR
ncbi:MAG TPA: hypothetical protein VF723_12545 [Pyrinomonadaceae bacterium]|jgi:hypothetical protein